MGSAVPSCSTISVRFTRAMHVTFTSSERPACTKRSSSSAARLASVRFTVTGSAAWIVT